MTTWTFNPDELATWAQATALAALINGNPLFLQPGISIPKVTTDQTTSGIYVPTWDGGPAGFPEPADAASNSFWLHFRFSNGFSGMNVGLAKGEFVRYPSSPLYVMNWLLGQVQQGA